MTGARVSKKCVCVAGIVTAVLVATTVEAKAERIMTPAPVVRAADHPLRSRHMVQPEQLRRAVLRYLEGELSGFVREVQVTLIEPQDPIPTSGGRIDMAVIPGMREEGLGRRMFHVQLSRNGRPLDTVEVLSDVAGFADVVVPSRLIKTDEVIDREDLTVTRVKLLDLKQQFVTDPNEVIGKSAVRPLQSQLPIRLASVKKPYAVRKGDRVTIEAKGRGLSIQTVGITKSGAELGQTVTVTNSDSGKELRAKVIGPGVVRVDF
ncbi:putative Flagella basal body P-ring formation protein FlgA [Nitrospira sp. KM1]|uniref:flagellar basal body P-ring formation chaperone FlgA n=1 Tax=Nitrospira sp. KM1 TaxID=1936990 RepID=UPI0013A72795|nr:flagellar basal body P-ring formation chaperone FlgA [Nitrospira sp. KM1]BCA54794.1 putative Flagella basal body P-ring formation protein FlgA [Nitrospira sp. KM1]